MLAAGARSLVKAKQTQNNSPKTSRLQQSSTYSSLNLAVTEAPQWSSGLTWQRWLRIWSLR